MKNAIIILLSLAIGYIACLVVTPDSQPTLMASISQGTSLFLGIVAGAAIWLLTGWIHSSQQSKQSLHNLKFEIKYNISKIEGWLEGLTRYRNAVNSDSLHRFYVYFDLSHIVTNTTNEMLVSGRLYEYLVQEEIGTLLRFLNDCSFPSERYMMNQLDENIKSFDKKKASGDVDYWEGKFKQHKKQLESILLKLGQ